MCSVRVAIFEAVGFLFFVAEAFVAFGNKDELGLGFGVTLITVRVILHRQRAVGFLDFSHGCSLLDSQNLEWIETFHLFLSFIGLKVDPISQAHQCYEQDHFEN